MPASDATTIANLTWLKRENDKASVCLTAALRRQKLKERLLETLVKEQLQFEREIEHVNNWEKSNLNTLKMLDNVDGYFNENISAPKKRKLRAMHIHDTKIVFTGLVQKPPLPDAE